MRAIADRTDWTLDFAIDEYRELLTQLRASVREWLIAENAPRETRHLAVAYGELAGELSTAWDYVISDSVASALARVAHRQGRSETARFTPLKPIDSDKLDRALLTMYKSAKRLIPKTGTDLDVAIGKYKKDYLENLYEISRQVIVALAGRGCVYLERGVGIAELAGAVSALSLLNAD